MSWFFGIGWLLTVFSLFSLPITGLGMFIEDGSVWGFALFAYCVSGVVWGAVA